MQKIYKFEENYYRMGHLSGVFVADDATVARAMGHTVHFSEALGKHSDISTKLTDDNLKLITDDQVIVKFFDDHLHGGTGVNPIQLFEEQEESEDDEEDEDEE